MRCDYAPVAPRAAATASAASPWPLGSGGTATAADPRCGRTGAGDDVYNTVTLGSGTLIASYSYCYDNANNLIDVSTTVGTPCSSSSPGRSFDGANEQLGTNHSYNLAGSETSNVSNLPSPGSVRTTSVWGDGQQPLTSAVNGGSGKNQDFLDFTNNTLLYSDTASPASDLLAAGPLGVDAYVLYNGSSAVDEYGYARDPGGQALAMRDSNGQEEFILSDGQGSVLNLQGSTGATVDAYHYTPTGARVIDTNTVPQPLGYLGAYTNYSTGLVHLGARFYDPSILALRRPIRNPTTPPPHRTTLTPTPATTPSTTTTSTDGT